MSQNDDFTVHIINDKNATSWPGVLEKTITMNVAHRFFLQHLKRGPYHAKSVRFVFKISNILYERCRSFLLNLTYFCTCKTKEQTKWKFLFRLDGKIVRHWRGRVHKHSGSLFLRHGVARGVFLFILVGVVS